MHPRRATLILNLALLLAGLTLLTPTPRAAPRSGPDHLLHLHWVRHEPALEPAWPDQPRFTSDSAFRPVPAAGLVLLSSSRHDTVTAVASGTGSVRWRFAADGPVRFAPAVWAGRAYFTSDDGHLYCVDLASGDLLWKFRGGPADRLLLGNERLISTWPARGGPVVCPEPSGRATVYFAAGIWPFMGVFLHALDAETGQVRWQNSGEGAIFIKQPHQTDAFAGIAPQGSLVLAGGNDRETDSSHRYLLVPGGRSIPACYDRHTGRRLHYRLADSSKLGGGPDITVAGDVYVNGGGAFELATGTFAGRVAEPTAAADTVLFSVAGSRCRAFDVAARPRPKPEKKPSAPSKAKTKSRAASEVWLGPPQATVRVPPTTTLLPAHDRLYGAGPGVVYAFPLPLQNGQTPVWQVAVEGTPVHLAATDDGLLVSTREGRLYAFGSTPRTPRIHPLIPEPLPTGDDGARRIASHVVSTLQVREGYAVLLGSAANAGLASELLRRTGLRLIVLEEDRTHALTLRDQFRRANLDSRRVAVINAPPDRTALPPYLASLVLGTVPDTVRDLDRLFSWLRPHGGVAWLLEAGPHRSRLATWQTGRPGEGQARLEEKNGEVYLRRDGPLPGAADWTHQHANPANTRVSRDQRVKAPLGLLWFGGPGHHGVLPRHGHGPVPQVCEGRLVIEGPDKLRAIDIYTGRLLWEARLPGVGKIYDNTAHQPGANAAGSNYVSTPEGIYVAHGTACLRLDPATGKTLERFQLPPLPGEKNPPPWTFLALSGNHLIAGSGPVFVAPPKGKKARPVPSVGSRRLTVLDRRTGRVRFSIQARHAFRHNAICVGERRLWAIDRLPATTRKKDSKNSSRLLAVELATGKPLWSTQDEVFGTWLSYSEKHDVLVEAGLMSRDTLADEPAGMRAYAGSSGRVLWHRPDYFGPGLIHGDRILKGGDARAGSGTACDLRTGEPIRVPDPLTGQPQEWRWVRTYGCNTPAASEHLVLFRSGAAGFYDLCNDGGTGNLGGFRSSCTLNLIAAGGVLTVPDYTRTCTCSYQQQCSVGLIHLPDTELWTFTTSRPVPGPIRRVGLNLGAPGSRRSSEGTLWLEYPAVGGPSPKLTVTTSPRRPETFRLHQSQVEGDGLRWVAASGVRGLSRLTLPLGKPGRYTVRLTFLEPENLSTGQRLFDVKLAGRTVLRRLDVSGAAGGPRRVLEREFPGIEVKRDLTVELRAEASAKVAETVLSGIEAIREE